MPRTRELSLSAAVGLVQGSWERLRLRQRRRSRGITSRVGSTGNLRLDWGYMMRFIETGVVVVKGFDWFGLVASSNSRHGSRRSRCQSHHGSLGFCRCHFAAWSVKESSSWSCA